MLRWALAEREKRKREGTKERSERGAVHRGWTMHGDVSRWRTRRTCGCCARKRFEISGWLVPGKVLQPVYRRPAHVSMPLLHAATSISWHTDAAACTDEKSFSPARAVFPGTHVPPSRGSLVGGGVIFLGSRNNFPNPPFRSSRRPELARATAGKFGNGERRDRVACSSCCTRAGSYSSRSSTFRERAEKQLRNFSFART